jgi:hypothetical protein
VSRSLEELSKSRRRFSDVFFGAAVLGALALGTTTLNVAQSEAQPAAVEVETVTDFTADTVPTEALTEALVAPVSARNEIPASRNMERTPRAISADVELSEQADTVTLDYEVESVVTENELPYETIRQNDPNLPAGTEKVIQEGAAGKTIVFEDVITLDTQEVSRYPVAEPITLEAVSEIIAVGTKVAEVSQPIKAAKSALGTAPAGTVWAQLAQCESSGNPSAVSRNGLYYGLYQFSLPTWKAMGGEGLPSQATAQEQTRLAEKLQARSGWGQWPACSRKLGLR